LAWVWRRREILDRNEALFWCLLSIGGTWTAILISLIPSQEYASAYGQQVLVLSSCVAIIVGAVVAIVYLRWPQTPKPTPIQEAKLPVIVPQTEPSLQENRSKFKETIWEFDVKWHLSGDVQPVPPFGSQDIPGSDKASKLHFTQRGKNLTLTGDMRGLKSSYMYHVQLAKPYTPLKRATDSIIGAEKAPYATFRTDQNGAGTWTIPIIEVNDLTRHGIIDRFAVWVNDAPKNASVLASDVILFKLEENKTQPQVAPAPDREREDFRNGVATEMHSILKKFIDPLNHLDISYLIWSSKAQESKAAILGKEDYLVLRSFYDAIEERNNYFAERRGFSVPALEPLNRKCVEALSRAYSEVAWLKMTSDTDSLLLKARKNNGLL